MTAPPDTASIDILRTVFPVVALHPDDAGEIARPDFFGTAFCVAPGIFMTAAHVVKNAQAAGRLAIAGPVSSGDVPAVGGVEVQSVEMWPDRDVAIGFCNVGALTPLNTWLVHRVQLLTDISTFGYPHAVTRSHDADRFNVVFRGYKGYVITTRGFDRLPGEPAVHEISCPFPEGLSGAPVLMIKDNTLVVLGIVLGVDTVTYGGVPQSVGIAMIGEEILELYSHKLGATLGAGLDLNAVVLRHPEAGSEGA